MSTLQDHPLYGAAILKLSFVLKGNMDEPGFRFVYFGALKEKGIKDDDVDAFIDAHRDELTEHINKHI